MLDEKSVDYLSIDTEGSEFEILRNFNFQNMVQKIMTIEHNHSELEVSLDRLFEEKIVTLEYFVIILILMHGI